MRKLNLYWIDEWQVPYDQSDAKERRVAASWFYNGILGPGVPNLNSQDVDIQFAGSMYHRPRTLFYSGLPGSMVDITHPFRFNDGFLCALSPFPFMDRILLFIQALPVSIFATEAPMAGAG